MGLRGPMIDASRSLSRTSTATLHNNERNDQADHLLSPRGHEGGEMADTLSNLQEDRDALAEMLEAVAAGSLRFLRGEDLKIEELRVELARIDAGIAAIKRHAVRPR